MVFLGGGEVDLKLLVSIQDVIRSSGALVGSISEPREKGEEQD